MQRDESVWTDATVYRPERFKNFTNDSDFIPYLIGPENCAGKNFANFEIPLVIRAFILKFRSMKILVKGREPYSGGTYRFTDRLLVEFERHD